MTSMRRQAMFGFAVMLGAVTLVGCGSDDSGGSASCPDDVPTPTLEVGGKEAPLTLGVKRVCEDGKPPASLHGETTPISGPVAVVDDTGDLVLHTDRSWEAEVNWSGGDISSPQLGTSKLAAPTSDGCFRLSITLRKGSAGADWQVFVRKGDTSVPCDRG
jgi:hypothetical protein